MPPYGCRSQGGSRAPAIWGVNGVNNLQIIWGTHIIWGTSANILNASQIIWGTSVWNDHIIWGTASSDVDLWRYALRRGIVGLDEQQAEL